jgi:hypothetical protein
MKNFLSLAAIATTIITLFTPLAGQAQGIFIQPFPSTGYSSTTIYVPSVPDDRVYTNGVTTTTSTELYSPSVVYPGSNSFPGSVTTPYYGSGYPTRYRQEVRPIVIFPQPNTYPRAVPSTCTTSIIGSPIPSPIALNRYTGTPCR